MQSRRWPLRLTQAWLSRKLSFVSHHPLSEATLCKTKAIKDSNGPILTLLYLNISSRFSQTSKQLTVKYARRLFPPDKEMPPMRALRRGHRQMTEKATAELCADGAGQRRPAQGRRSRPAQVPR